MRRLVCAALICGALISEAAAELVLERVVLVSRHGVRSPTNSDQLANYSADKAWPSWPVKDGCLTPHGKIAAARMGAFYRRLYTVRGLLPVKPRPTANQVYVWTDVDQRTQVTGVGLIEGLFACEKGRNCPRPACLTCGPLDISEDCAPKLVDPLFHPVRSQGACKYEAGAQDEIRRLLAKAQEQPDYNKMVQDLQDVLGCCNPKLCTAQGLSCKLGTVPSSAEVTDYTASLKGAISIGSTASEVFLLEYGQNMLQKNVAWGLASEPAKFIPLMKLHGVQFDLMQRTKVLAKPQGSALLNQVLETLRQAAGGASDPLRPVPRDAKLVIYVGHDTNLANIGGMLDLNWQLGTYLPNETPPAGAMAFELLRDTQSREYFVRVAYYSQKPEQMRKLTRLRLPPLSGPPANSAPDLAPIAIGHLCPKTGTRDGACLWSEFYATAGQTLNPACARPSAQ